MTGVGTIAGGILLAVSILFLIGILILAALSGAFESEPEPEPQTSKSKPISRPLTILDTPEGMAEANYYRARDCVSNDDGNWICPQNTQTWEEYQIDLKDEPTWEQTDDQGQPLSQPESKPLAEPLPLARSQPTYDHVQPSNLSQKEIDEIDARH
jgi:hypothetical protein